MPGLDQGHEGTAVPSTKRSELVCVCVCVHSDPPDFEEELADCTAELGETVKLACRVTGTPKPIVSWYKGRPLQPEGCGSCTSKSCTEGVGPGRGARREGQASYSSGSPLTQPAWLGAQLDEVGQSRAFVLVSQTQWPHPPQISLLSCLV